MLCENVDDGLKTLAQNVSHTVMKVTCMIKSLHVLTISLREPCLIFCLRRSSSCRACALSSITSCWIKETFSYTLWISLTKNSKSLWSKSLSHASSHCLMSAFAYGMSTTRIRKTWLANWYPMRLLSMLKPFMTLLLQVQAQSAIWHARVQSILRVCMVLTHSPLILRCVGHFHWFSRDKLLPSISLFSVISSFVSMLSANCVLHGLLTRRRRN
mmetsp:Transcript_14171/g.27547  ORF Transcript_14171/g.27547 Transcript_14171/m.27547 type:complete len:214 (-) Transcript_14171:694-1335(-)